jgi:hypothetical protein
MKLRSVREGQSRRLLGHRAPDFWNPMADANDRGLSRSIKEFPPIRGKKPRALTTNGHGKKCLKATRKDGVVV